MDYSEKIRSLKLELPPAPKPEGSYRPVVLAGRWAYLSGQISRAANGKILSGKVGGDLSLDEGKQAARLAALNVLSVIRDLMGFEKFGQLVRVVGYVQVVPDFYDLSQVMNGASDLFLEVFGENGVHARSAAGMASLPLNAAVEIEATIHLKADP